MNEPSRSNIEQSRVPTLANSPWGLWDPSFILLRGSERISSSILGDQVGSTFQAFYHRRNAQNRSLEAGKTLGWRPTDDALRC